MLIACLLLGVPGLPGQLDAPAAHLAQDPAPRRAVGVVLDADGRPVSGARITAEAKLRIVPGSYEPELETDADGRFEFRWTPSGETFWIQLDIGGAALSTETRNLLTAPPDEAVDLGRIVLMRGLPLELRLVDEAGAPLCAGWRVELELGPQAWESMQRDDERGLFRCGCVPHGTFGVRVSRDGEPGPSYESRVEQDGSGHVRAIRVASRRQIWVRVGLPYPEGAAYPAWLARGLSVLAVTPDRGSRIEALYDEDLHLHVFDGLPAGPLDLRVVGASVLRPYEAPLPERGFVEAPLRGALDLKVVLLEQGSAGPIGTFEVETDVPRAETQDVPGEVAKLVTGLLPGVDALELFVPGADRPHVIVELADLTAEELTAGRVVRTLPNWTALRGRLVDETGAAPRGVSVELFSVDAEGDERAAGDLLEVDRGGDYAFSRLVPGPHLLRVWWAERHGEDFPVLVGERETDLDVRRGSPALLEVVFEGSWPDGLGLVLHHADPPAGYPDATPLRPTVEGRFGPFELAPGEVDLAVGRPGSGRSWQLERVLLAPGPRVVSLDLATLPALVCWDVRVDGASVQDACRGQVRPLRATSEWMGPVRLGTAGARRDGMLVDPVDYELTLTAEDGSWSACVVVDGLRPGEVREVPVQISRARRRVRLQVDGEPLRDNDFRVELRTPEGVLLQQERRTDAEGEADLMFVSGVLTVFGVGTGRDPVSVDWTDGRGRESQLIELR